MAGRKLTLTRPSRKTTLAERLAYYSRPQPNGCRLWIGSRNAKGYGHLKWEGVVWQAHRLAWTEANGPIPPGKQVCHRCDTPACIEEPHLFLGTNDDNMADRQTKGRQAFNRGTANGRAKLTEADIPAIRADRRGSVALAAQYGVTPTVISNIRHGRSWRHA